MMDHNEFDFVEDLISPLHNFMLEVLMFVVPTAEAEEHADHLLTEFNPSV